MKSYPRNFSFEESQELLVTSTTTATTTAMAASEVDSSTLVVIIVVSCICISLVISTVVAIYYCNRKKVLCFSTTKGKSINKNNDTYVLSISRNISNNQRSPNDLYEQYCAESSRIHELNEIQHRDNELRESNPSDGRSSISCFENGINSNVGGQLSGATNNDQYQTENISYLPMQGFISSLMSRYENVHPGITEVANRSGMEEDDDFQCTEQIKDKGFCVVNGDFDPNTGKYKRIPGLLKINKNETLVILQHDLGSGWTCVRNQQKLQTGFVPTRYLNISL